MKLSVSFSPIQRRLLLATVLLLGLAYLVLLFYRGFCDPDEGRYAEVPREMVVSGHWGEMRMLGYRYYEKPPLAYWMVAPAIAVCGAHDWATRIPLFINIVLSAGLFYFLTRRFWPDTASRMALLVLLSMAGFMVGFSLLITDGFLTFWFSLTCISIFLAFQAGVRPRPKLFLLLLAAVAAVLGVLTKGAVAVVLPAGILLIWLAWERRLKDLLTLCILPASLLFLALLVPLIAAIERYNPGFTQQFIFNEHIARFTGTRASQLHEEPFWFYLAVLLPLLMPWTLFLFRAIRIMVIRRLPATDSLTRFCIIWVAVVLVFFSCGAGKLMSYILPAIPPLGLLLGRWGVWEPSDGTRRDRQLWNLGMVGPLLAALAIPIIWLTGYFQLLPTVLAPLAGISALALIPIAAALLIVRAIRGFGNFHGAMVLASSVMFTAALLLSPLAGKDFNVLLHLNSAHVFKKLACVLKPADRLVVFWDYRPALPFYTQRLPYSYQVKNELEYGIFAERDRAGYLHFPDDLCQMLENAPGRIFAVLDPEDFDNKFKALNLNFRPVTLPRDRDTLIVEILPDTPPAPQL